MTGRGSVWLGKGLEGCSYHLLLPFVSLVRLHSCIYTWKKNRKYVRTQILAFKAERKNCEILQGFVPLPAAELVVLGIGTACPVSLPKHHLDGCHHHLSCMGTHGHPGFGSWWKQTVSLRVKCAPTLSRHAGVWALFIPVALAAILSSPVGGCGTEFANRFLLFALNMLLLIPLNYSFCMTSNRDYVFPFLHLFHRSCFTPYHQLCLLPERVMYWTCPWVDAFPYLGYSTLYSSLNLFWFLRRGWSKMMVCCGFLQKLQGEIQSVLIFKSPTLIFLVLSVTWCSAKINSCKKINFNYHVLELIVCIYCFSEILSFWNQFVYILSDRPTYQWERASCWIILSQ